MDVITLATIPAVLALVNLAKQFGIRGKHAALAAVLLGIGIQWVDAAQNPLTLDTAQAVRISVHGLILGLSAAGLYDLKPSTPLVQIRSTHAPIATTNRTGQGKHTHE